MLALLLAVCIFSPSPVPVQSENLKEFREQEKMLKNILRWSSGAAKSHTKLTVNKHITPKAGPLKESESLIVADSVLQEK